MPELSRDEQKVVKRWWMDEAIFIYQRGYLLDKYNLSSMSLHLPETSRSFEDILNSGAIISTTAKRRVDKRSMKLTIVRSAVVGGDTQEQDVTLDVTYFDVPAIFGCYTLMVTPIIAPSRPLSVRLPRLLWSPLSRIEESDTPESELSSTDSSLESSLESSNTANTLFLSTDSPPESSDTATAATYLLTGLPLESFDNQNTSGTLDVLTDLPLETFNSTNTLLIDPQLIPNNANTSFISTDSSLQSYRAANMSFLSTDSSLQSYYSANTSFISTDSSLQSYHTAYASVSSLSSTIYSVSTSSGSSDVSLPYSVNSVNSYKSRKTVLYPRREHRPPVAISSQELSESSLFV